MKICSKCKIGKEEEEEFYIFTSKQRKTPYLSPRCKSCSREDNAKRKTRKGYREWDNNYKKKLRETVPNWSELEKRRIRRFKNSHPGVFMYYNAKRRAKTKGYEFNIELIDIIIPKYCPYLNIPLIYGVKGDYENTPSLDRLDNSKGYVKGNILVVSKKGNSMKNSASFEELKTFCTNILKMIESKDIVQTTTNKEVVEV